MRNKKKERLSYEDSRGRQAFRIRLIESVNDDKIDDDGSFAEEQDDAEFAERGGSGKRG